MRLFVTLLLVFVSSIAAPSRTLGSESSSTVNQRMGNLQLNVRGAADYPEIVPLLEEFQRRNPNIALTYTEHSTKDLYQKTLSGEFSDADVITSSAMDLQIKLVNDGYAQPYISLETQSLPEWAKWRNEIFGFTYEPAVIAYNNEKLAEFGESDINSRADMLDYIRANSSKVSGRIGTFDIENVGVGYLLWSYDSQQTGSYGRILESFGINKVRLYSSSASMLNALAEGEILIAYNVLGSYAKSFVRDHPQIKMVLPTDYTTAIMRTAFIPKTASNPQAARKFVDFLISLNGQKILAEQSSLSPVRSQFQEDENALPAQNRGPVRSIPLGLRLLVMTDKLKRAKLINEWKSALTD